MLLDEVKRQHALCHQEGDGWIISYEHYSVAELESWACCPLHCQPCRVVTRCSRPLSRILPPVIPRTGHPKRLSNLHPWGCLKPSQAEQPNLTGTSSSRAWTGWHQGATASRAGRQHCHVWEQWTNPQYRQPTAHSPTRSSKRPRMGSGTHPASPRCWTCTFPWWKWRASYSFAGKRTKRLL